MPTYEYACSSCGHEWEFEQSIKDAPLTECPSCKQPAAKRQISKGTGFILKGSGWGSDLYSSSSNKKPEPAKAASGASEGSGSSGSSEGSGASTSSEGSGGSSGGDTGSSDKGPVQGGAAKSSTPPAAA
jgi:putative FmdB family regulatory protein